MCSRASSSRSVDASIHAASSKALTRSGTGASSPAASRAARIRCAPRLSPRTTHAQPNPLTMSSATSGSFRGAPGQRRVDVGAFGPGERQDLALTAAAHPVSGRSRPRPRTTRRARRAPDPSVPSRPGLRARTRGCCRAAGNGPGAEPLSSSTMTRERLASRPTTSMAAAAGTPSASSTNSTPGERCATGERRQRPQPRWSSGNSSSCSIRSSPAAPGDVPAGGWSGSRNTLKRSSRRRVISPTDNVFVRAAASSMASGSPSSERHRSCTASSGSAPPSRLPCAAVRRPNSWTASARERGASSKSAPHRPHRAAPG